MYQKQCLGQRSGVEVTVPSSLVRTSSIFLYGQEKLTLNPASWILNPAFFMYLLTRYWALFITCRRQVVWYLPNTNAVGRKLGLVSHALFLEHECSHGSPWPVTTRSGLCLLWDHKLCKSGLRPLLHLGYPIEPSLRLYSEQVFLWWLIT